MKEEKPDLPGLCAASEHSETLISKSEFGVDIVDELSKSGSLQNNYVKEEDEDFKLFDDVVDVNRPKLHSPDPIKTEPDEKQEIEEKITIRPKVVAAAPSNWHDKAHFCDNLVSCVLRKRRPRYEVGVETRPRKSRCTREFRIANHQWKNPYTSHTSRIVGANRRTDERRTKLCKLMPKKPRTIEDTVPSSNKAKLRVVSDVFRYQPRRISQRGTHSILQQPRRISHGVILNRPFKCSDCSQTFDEVEALNDHVRSHSSAGLLDIVAHPNDANATNNAADPVILAPPYRCSNCNRSFGQATALKDHIHLRHKGAERDHPYHCSDCCKTFDKVEALSNHRILNHNCTGRTRCKCCGLFCCKPTEAKARRQRTTVQSQPPGALDQPHPQQQLPDAQNQALEAQKQLSEPSIALNPPSSEVLNQPSEVLNPPSEALNPPLDVLNPLPEGLNQPTEALNPQKPPGKKKLLIIMKIKKPMGKLVSSEGLLKGQTTLHQRLVHSDDKQNASSAETCAEEAGSTNTGPSMKISGRRKQHLELENDDRDEGGIEMKVCDFPDQTAEDEQSKQQMPTGETRKPRACNILKKDRAKQKRKSETGQLWSFDPFLKSADLLI